MAKVLGPVARKVTSFIAAGTESSPHRASPYSSFVHVSNDPNSRRLEKSSVVPSAFFEGWCVENVTSVQRPAWRTRSGVQR